VPTTECRFQILSSKIRSSPLLLLLRPQVEDRFRALVSGTGRWRSPPTVCAGEMTTGCPMTFSARSSKKVIPTLLNLMRPVRWRDLASSPLTLLRRQHLFCIANCRSGRTEWKHAMSSFVPPFAVGREGRPATARATSGIIKQSCCRISRRLTCSVDLQHLRS